MATTESVPTASAPPRPGPRIRAVRASGPGDPAALRVEQVEPGDLAPGTIRVAVRAAGVNRSDALACRGIIPGPFPRTLGRDFAGVVVDGPDTLIGRRVWGSGGALLGLARDGTHAESVDVPADVVTPIPDGLEDIAAAASALSYVTAFHALERAGHFAEGDIAVVTGAAGGVGGAAGALAHHRGAHVVGVVRDLEEAEALRATPASAHFAELVAAGDDLAERLRAAAAAGARVAVDVIGGPSLPALLSSLGIGGGACLLGALPGSVSAIDPLEFYRQELRLSGLHTGRLSAAESARALQASAEGLATGALTPTTVSGVHALEDAPTAYRHVDQGGTGRPVLVP